MGSLDAPKIVFKGALPFGSIYVVVCQGCMESCVELAGNFFGEIQWHILFILTSAVQFEFLDKTGADAWLFP